MNYLELIRAFWRSHEENSFTTTEIAVYFHLLEVCNICQWKNPFKRNNAKIEADLSISFNTLKNARNKLQQAGLINFKTLNGSPNVQYTLSKFDKVSNEVTNEVGDEVGSEVSDEVLPTKDKLNKTETKLNNSKSHSVDASTDKKKKELPFWKSFIAEFDSWYETHFGVKYVYLAQDFAHLKKLYQFLKKRAAITRKFEFTEENLLAAFKFFLEKAWEKDKWLRSNFSIPNILSQFNQIANGTKSNTSQGNPTGGEVSTASIFSKIAGLSD